MSGLVLFLGPTLRADAVTLPCRILPPARQGDIFRAVREHQPHAIGLIDGVFLDVASVWHREILWALDRGVHVLGASSMGALRAAELDRYGMVGIGAIYAAFRDGHFDGYSEAFEDDDEVAIVHAPPAAGGMALSDAMVDLRATLNAAVAAGMTDDSGRQRLAAAMKALAFPQRSLAALAHAADPPLAAWIGAHAVHQKALDAQALLHAAASLGAAPFAAQVRFTRALAWERFVEDQTNDLPPSPLLHRLRVDQPAAWRVLRRQALGRLAALRGASPADAPLTRAAFDLFRIEHALVQHDDIQNWLRHNATNIEDLARLMQQDATLDAASDPPGLEATMLDLLRLSGRFANLAAPR